MDFSFLLVSVITILMFVALIGLVLGRLYRRATREVSLVKTGSGGKKVIMDGGTIVIPLLHEISPVNMKTLRGAAFGRGCADHSGPNAGRCGRGILRLGDGHRRRHLARGTDAGRPDL